MLCLKVYILSEPVNYENIDPPYCPSLTIGIVYYVSHQLIKRGYIL